MDETQRKWPELIGKSGAEAVEKIKSDTGLTNVHIVPPNSMVTMDYRTDRIRVYVDGQGKVKQSPTFG